MPDTTMAKAYAPNEVENRIYAWWEGRGYFTPEQQLASGLADATKTPFVISMPPPNVTGILHLGHAITNAVEDALIRYHRMEGRPTLWVPGSDHAGIATQNVVEKKLAQQGVTRHDMGRERFVEEVWGWKAEYHGTISRQQRRMGISCDWGRERFTLDDGLSEAVHEAFIRLYDEGLIYRGKRLVNWCPRCMSAISDLEVDYEEEAGRFYTFRYPLEEGGFVEVSTTRPETILGDTAVAVHPDDPRYAHLVGRYALVPVLGRRIPIIADAHVDPEFGTGALKVTPGHDPNDYEIGLRHNLEMLNVMNLDATMNENAGKYAGQDRFEARRTLWAEMKELGLVVRDEERVHQVGHCQRCGTIVEPLLSLQWWVKTQPLAEPSIAAVRDGRIRILPQRFEKIYYHWMENIRDWCISRQLWWGHRIPIWYGSDGTTFAARNTDEAQEKANAHYGRPADDPVEIHQDEDVLDTWFSSGLWPFSTLGWPQQTEDLARYYPTTVLETGYDILFFWVARMIMLGMKFTGEVPFSVVYLHGIVRDEKGRKMSKSLGNSLDPLDLIAEYGADALRFTLLTTSSPGNDLKVATQRVEGNRNFANKIWNAARFAIMNLEGHDLPLEKGDIHGRGFALPAPDLLALPDRWILSRLDETTAEVTRLIEEYNLGEAGRQLYEFLWNEFCDWYIEAAKVRLYDGTAEDAQATRQVVAHVLERSLRLLHPFMPYLTEEIWQNLPGLAESGQDRAVIVSRWPTPEGLSDADAERDFGALQEAVRAIRNARSEYDVTPSKRIPAHISAGEYAAQLTANLPTLALLARISPDETMIATDLPAPEKSVTLALAGMTVYLPLAGLVDFAAERTRLNKELENVDKQLARIEGLLGNEGFVAKAPANVIERETIKRAELTDQRIQLVERLGALE